jgi:hypothetical protein
MAANSRRPQASPSACARCACNLRYYSSGLVDYEAPSSILRKKHYDELTQKAANTRKTTVQSAMHWNTIKN